VLVSPAPPDVLLERLRDAGLAPLAESFDGVVQLAVAPSRRAEPPRRRTSRDLAESVTDLSDDQVRAVLAAVRAGDRVADERPAPDGPSQPELTTATAPLATIDLLSDAAETNRRTFISYVDHNGIASERIVEPVRVADGWLTAYDTSEQGIGRPRTYALHRIATARILEESTE
jgi:predicted DNA-binding transcriptional regulator YafY